ncbi:MAG TPA: methyltransferase [Azospirillaceae bacterium]|nr:methyltransferase [Azospirillaceae bacterium]
MSSADMAVSPTPDVTPDAILQLGFGFWASKALLSAVELGLFTELAKGPDDLQGLTMRLGLHPRSARDFLDALVALGVLTREGGRYANSPAAALYLDRAKESYVGGLLEMANNRLYPFWANLTEALRTGELQNEAKGGGDSPFAAIYATPDMLEGFLKGMTGVSLPVAHKLAERFTWGDYRSFADIGCAQGGLTAAIAARHKHLAAVGFDLPPVRPVFEAYVRAKGLESRALFQPGDFFKDPLPSADVIVMGHILHDWDLAQKRMLLAKAYDALPSGGAVVVYDGLIDDDRRTNAFGLLMSLNMLIETPGGFDYSGADCQGWMREAGFVQTRAEMLTATHGMVVGIKP